MDVEPSRAVLTLLEGPRFRHARIEFNPGSVVSGNDPVEVLTSSLMRAWAAARPFVSTSSLLVEARVSRLDLCRDFLVENCSVFVAGLEHLPRAYANKLFRAGNPRMVAGQTLVVGNSEGEVKLYDKGAERTNVVGSPGRNEGTLRWELMAKTGWLRRYGPIATVDDLSHGKIEHLVANRWAWSKMGSPITGRTQAITRILDSSLTSNHQLKLLGYMTAAEAGREVGIMRSTADGYRADLAALGVVAVTASIEQPIRLDFHLARAVEV